MSYQILARKYRPQKFADLTGQETTARILQAAVLQNRIAPAYLFSGPRGIGKTTCARIFAKALNCHKRGAAAEPCGECASCTEITRGGSLDVLEIDAASHTQVDNIREVVVNTVAFAPVRDRFKVFIIDEVHMLSTHSFNALLKTLEEPPPHAVFILATTEFHKIPATIASRCQRFRFLQLTHKEILGTLEKIAQKERIAVEAKGLSLIAKSAAGAMRDALSLLDQVLSHLPAGGEAGSVQAKKVEEILGAVDGDLLLAFIERVAERDAKGALEATSRVLNHGIDISHFLRELRQAFREMLIQKCGWQDAETASPLGELPTGRFALAALLRAAQLLTNCAEQMRRNDFPRLVFECYAVQLCQESVSADELLGRLEQLEGKGPAPETGRADGPAQKNFSPAPAPPERREKKAPPVPAEKISPAPSQIPEEEDPSGAQAGIPAASGPNAAAPAGGEGDWRPAWGRLLSSLHSTKPSLANVLQSASVQLSDGRVELTVAKAFHLEGLKRQQKFLESAIEQAWQRRVPVSLKLEEVKKTAPEVLDIVEGGGEEGEEETAVEEPPAFAANGGGEVYEVVEEKSSAKEDLSLEDEGARNFFKIFDGKVTRK